MVARARSILSAWRLQLLVIEGELDKNKASVNVDKNRSHATTSIDTCAESVVSRIALCKDSPKQSVEKQAAAREKLSSYQLQERAM